MTRPYRPAPLASDLATWTHHELRDEIERLRAALKGIEVYATSKDDAKGLAVRALMYDRSALNCDEEN